VPRKKRWVEGENLENPMGKPWENHGKHMNYEKTKGILKTMEKN